VGWWLTWPKGELTNYHRSAEMLQFHPMGLPHPGGSGRCANVFKGLRRQMAVGIPTPTPQVLHSRSYCVGQELRNPLFYQRPGMSQVSGRRVPKQGRTTCVAETPLAAKRPSRSTRPRITRATGQLPMYSQRLAPSACELACQGSKSRARLFAYLHKWCTSVTYLPYLALLIHQANYQEHSQLRSYRHINQHIN